MPPADTPSNPRTWRDRRVLRWAMFDVATSTYIALVPGFFGLYFATVLAQGNTGAGALWGATAALAVVASAVIAPLAGAWADRHGRWLRVITLATIVTIAATALLSLSLPLGMAWAAAIFLLAQVGYTVGIGQYDSMLVRLAQPAKRSRASTLAWATGMLGGILALTSALWLLREVPREMQVDRLPLVFLLAAGLFAVLAAPALLAMRGIVASPDRATAPVRASSPLRDVWRTCREWRRHETAVVLLVGFFLVNDVVVTLQFFGSIVLRERFDLLIRQYCS